MPQAPDYLRAEFGINDGPVIKMLCDRGYTLTGRYDWIVPPGHEVTEEENRAIWFLCLEWDFSPAYWHSELREEW